MPNNTELVKKNIKLSKYNEFNSNQKRGVCGILAGDIFIFTSKCGFTGP